MLILFLEDEAKAEDQQGAMRIVAMPTKGLVACEESATTFVFIS